MASTSTSRTSGWCSSIDSNRRGASQRAVVPIIPSRAVPATFAPSEATSDDSDSSSERMRAARVSTASPSLVGRPVARSMSVAPSSFSSRATWVETFDCTVCSARAAAEKPPFSATASRALSWRRSIARSDVTHL